MTTEEPLSAEEIASAQQTIDFARTAGFDQVWIETAFAQRLLDEARATRPVSADSAAGREAAKARDLREAAEDAYRVMDAATKWAAHQRPESDAPSALDEHLRGYDALLAGQVRLGQALGILSRLANHVDRTPSVRRQ